jgi:cytochrome bd-type quinol oxidase subunit 2
MLRISGYWLICLGILHVFVHAWLFAKPLMDIVQDGWFNAVSPYPLSPPYDREDAFWCMMIAPFLLMLGQLCCWADTKNISLPGFPGWVLLLTAVIGITLEPVSGFWLMLPPSLLMVVDSRQRKSLPREIS